MCHGLVAVEGVEDIGKPLLLRQRAGCHLVTCHLVTHLEEQTVLGFGKDQSSVAICVLTLINLLL